MVEVMISHFVLVQMKKESQSNDRTLKPFHP